MYLTITLRGKQYEIDVRIVEDDPSTNAFESAWEFVEKGTNAPCLDLTDAEEEMISLAIGEAYADGHFDYVDEC